MTLLVASIPVDTVDDLAPRAEQAFRGGADAIEIRADTFTEPPARLSAFLQAATNRTWIVTRRSVAEGGRCAESPTRRTAFLVEAVAGTAALIDFELADWKADDEARRQLSQLVSGSGAPRLILSAHDLTGPPADLPGLVDEMLCIPGVAAAKVAYTANHICDTFVALDLMHRYGSKVIATAMGEDGLWTRALAKKLGAFTTYASLSGEEATAPGQLSLSSMTTDYRWRAMDGQTRLYGVIGDPIGHSLSPALHNRWLARSGANAVYLPLLGRAKGGCIRRFLDECLQRPWLDLGGLSVTLPHKSTVLRWAGDGVDWLAVRLGALNTLCFRDGAVAGFNTDCYAAIDALGAALGRRRTELNGLRVDVLGTGGAARALVYGLPMYGCEVTVFGRSFDKASRLAEEFQARAAPWDDRAGRSADVLINCTSVGLSPDVEESPMPVDALAGYQLVFDLIYNPLQTRLLRDATAAGVATCNGIDMFVRQAAMQFELWTGQAPDTSDAAEFLEERIRGRGVSP